MTAFQSAFRDPVVALELSTLVLTLLYLGVLTLRAGMGRQAVELKGNSVSRSPLQLFDVGSLVSLPKRSLRDQRTCCC